mgnify:CR=1 FL=1
MLDAMVEMFTVAEEDRKESSNNWTNWIKGLDRYVFCGWFRLIARGFCIILPNLDIRKYLIRIGQEVLIMTERAKKDATKGLR